MPIVTPYVRRPEFDGLGAKHVQEAGSHGRRAWKLSLVGGVSRVRSLGQVGLGYSRLV